VYVAAYFAAWSAAWYPVENSVAPPFYGDPYISTETRETREMSEIYMLLIIGVST
jgi:hypothetical protein